MEVGGLFRFDAPISHGVDNQSRPNITILFTVVAVAVSFAWLGVEDPSKWRTGVALYILGRAYRVWHSPVQF
jgi:hypothetical protein